MTPEERRERRARAASRLERRAAQYKEARETALQAAAHAGGQLTRARLAIASIRYGARPGVLVHELKGRSFHSPTAGTELTGKVGIVAAVALRRWRGDGCPTVKVYQLKKDGTPGKAVREFSRWVLDQPNPHAAE